MKTSKRAQELLNYTRPDQKYLRAVLVFASQNPGFEWGNYSSGDYKRSLAAYRGDARPVAKQLREIRKLTWRFNGLNDVYVLEASKRAYSGRLTLLDRPDGSVVVDYCTGQYWPTEYRQAALAVIREAIRMSDEQHTQHVKLIFGDNPEPVTA